jgi:hypothetical protein
MGHRSRLFLLLPSCKLPIFSSILLSSVFKLLSYRLSWSSCWSSFTTLLSVIVFFLPLIQSFMLSTLISSLFALSLRVLFVIFLLLLLIFYVFCHLCASFVRDANRRPLDLGPRPRRLHHLDPAPHFSRRPSKSLAALDFPNYPNGSASGGNLYTPPSLSRIYGVRRDNRPLLHYRG